MTENNSSCQTIIEWWEGLPAIRKFLIIDYKQTNYKWDSLNAIDKEIIKHYYANSHITKMEEEE